MTRTPPPSLLALALSLLCMVGIATAQTRPKADAATEAQLAAARKDLAEAARRVAELSRQLGRDDSGPVRIDRRVMRKPVLGVLLAPDPTSGVRIAGVTPDSAAAKAGLRGGDRIISVDGQAIAGKAPEQRVAGARKLLDGLDVRTPVRLGIERAGKRSVLAVTPRMDEQVFVLRGNYDAPLALQRTQPPGVPARIRTEVYRIGPDGACEGEHCKLPALADVFRWNGLNLASVDRSLGRYFGTDHGVLVLGAGELQGLQPGDVIQKVDGRAVASPREAMDVLRAKPDGSLVLVEYLRDRRQASTRVTVPKATPINLPLPPPPPPAPPAAPAPPPPPPAARLEGVWTPAAMAEVPAAIPAAPPMPPAPPAPPAPVERQGVL